MKLKFITHELVEFDQNIVFEKVIIYLEEKNYNIIEQSKATILFNDEIKSWKVVSNYTYYSKINKGQFEITRRGEQTDVYLIYYLSITTELIQLLLIVFASIYIGYIVLFLAIFFILNFVFKVKNIHKNIIKSILKV